MMRPAGRRDSAKGRASREVDSPSRIISATIRPDEGDPVHREGPVAGRAGDHLGVTQRP